MDPSNITTANSVIQIGTGAKTAMLGASGVSVTEAIPEPTTYALIGVGLAGMLLRRRYRGV